MAVPARNPFNVYHRCRKKVETMRTDGRVRDERLVDTAVVNRASVRSDAAVVCGDRLHCN